MIEAALTIVEAGRDLSLEQMSEAMGLVMSGRCDDDEIARLLAALHRKGETVAEVAGAAAALRAKMTPIRSGHTGLVDIVGTGGDCSGTFNISTAAALVAAAAGVPVAKHGNRAVTSRSGASDVLAALGVNIEADLECVEGCLDELGICFCFAPLHHAAMKHVAAVRHRLGTPTIFNILGPLCNPAGAPRQLLGVGRPELRLLLAEALLLLGTEQALVVHGADGLDEVTLGDRTLVTEAAAGQLREFAWTPADFGVAPAPREALVIDGPAESARLIREIFAGRPGPARDIVVANAAAALWLAGRAPTPRAAAELAAATIDAGKPRDLLARLAERSHRKQSLAGG